MSKTLATVAGITGAGAAGVGGYMISRKNGDLQPKETLRSKYLKAILENNDGLWNTKFEIFKSSHQPTHRKLVDAKSKHTTHINEAKALHQQGCKEIYDSPWEDSSHLKDFKTYCSKNVKDMFTQPNSWIVQEDTKTSGKWDQKLTDLKGHEEDKKGILNKGLKDIKDKLTTTDSWDEAKRNSLRDWCNGIGGEIFMGEEDITFANAKLYCVSQ
ncbi:hypothetical protein HF1_08540 [Mycoplasma haemofelis str. Langford 1]|uniref:Uncharacterized protein n=2 Tax=Mycoplasma haemofelis TaxID=29501 RepID=F6FIZ3_MYCHI|nr:hypothetical protein [Mycoplasma haemofelis]AEG73191.1 hypothetical protein MHF_0934 [Mycoplasma haemofelis Ohio2]CBY92862.1 hypothetical protein HF1_08540 [Mycoplasma haemofelis str. Langford 1]